LKAEIVSELKPKKLFLEKEMREESTCELKMQKGFELCSLY